MSNTFTETTSTSWFGRISNSFGGRRHRAHSDRRHGHPAVLERRPRGADGPLARRRRGRRRLGRRRRSRSGQRGQARPCQRAGDDRFDAERPGFRDRSAKACASSAMSRCTSGRKSRNPRRPRSSAAARRPSPPTPIRKGWDDNAINSGDVQAAWRTPKSVDGDLRAQSSRFPKASSAPSRSTSRCWTRSAARRRCRSSRISRKRSRRPMPAARSSASSMAASISAGTPHRRSIGDYRIKYELAPLGAISVIGQQQGSQFRPIRPSPATSF